jgi:uncharacterized membrane protein
MTNPPPPGSDEPSPTGGLPPYGSTPPPSGGSEPPHGGWGSPPPGYGYQPPVGGGGAYSATDAIGYGWRKFTQNVGPLLLATLIVVVGGLVLSFLSDAVAQTPDFTDTDGNLALEGGELALSLVVQTLVGAVSYVLSAMLIRCCLDLTEGKTVDLGSAFGRLDVVKVVLAGLLLSVLTTIGLVLCLLPGIAFSIFSFFTLYFVVDKGFSPFTALTSSFSLVSKNFGDALLTGLLAALVILAGFLALCVGILVAAPVVTLAGAYAYKAFLREPIAP